MLILQFLLKEKSRFISVAHGFPKTFNNYASTKMQSSQEGNQPLLLRFIRACYSCFFVKEFTERLYKPVDRFCVKGIY